MAHDTRRERLVVAAGLVWLTPGRLLVQRRSSQALHGAGLLELAGGKIELGESPVEALRRELVEEWGTAASTLRITEIVEVLHHIYPAPGPEVLLLVYDVDASAWGDTWQDHVDPEPGVVLEAHDLSALPLDRFLAADRPFLERLVRERARRRPNP